MKKLGHRTAIMGLVTLLLLCLVPVPALAGSGIGVGPTVINVDNAVRGADYEQSMFIMNGGHEQATYTLAATGEAASWLSFYLEGEAVEEISVPALGDVDFTVRISVPDDAINGEHTATVVVSLPPPDFEEGGSGQGIALTAESMLTINVVGTQVISGTATGINAEDVELGYPLIIELFFENTGNVAIAPLIEVEIIWDGETLDSFTYDETTVGAGQAQFINVEWDTTGNAPAEYGASVTVSLEGGTIAEEDLTFNILPLGTLTRSGELKGIDIEGNPTIGIVSRVTATFANTGQINTWAVFTGEVYLDGNLIGTITSYELMVERGKEGELTAYFTPEQEGNYTIKGYVTYEGKQTETKEIYFTATATGGTVTNPDDGETTTSQPFNVWIPVIGGIAALALILVIILTVPWARLQPAREIIIAQWNRLRMSGKLSKWG